MSVPGLPYPPEANSQGGSTFDLAPTPRVRQLDDLFYHLHLREIQGIAASLNLPAEGTKDELATRLGASPRFDSTDALILLDTQVLRQICGRWGLPTTGFRGELIDRLAESIGRPQVPR
jgi:hypothetical protein